MALILLACVLACEILQILVFIVVIRELARYTPIEQRLLYCFTRVEYASAATVAFLFILPTTHVYVASLCGLAQGISTSILVAASMLLKARSNPQRSESKVQIPITTSGIATHEKSLTSLIQQALNWLMIGTLILFGRSLILVFGYRIFNPSVWGQVALLMDRAFTMLTMDSAAIMTVKAVLRLDIEANPMPAWLVYDFDHPEV